MVLVSDDGERTMLSQRVAFPAGAAQRVADEARGAAWVHLSGYVLLDGRGAEIAGGLGARDDRQRLGVGACPVPDAARFAALLAAARPSVVFADLREAAALLDGRGADDPGDAPGLVARLASRLGSVVVVTTPGGPVAAMPGDRPIRARSAARVRRARDTTGAGDAVAAAVTAELLEAAWPPTGGELARALSRAGALAAEVVASEGAQGEARGERSGRGAC